VVRLPNFVGEVVMCEPALRLLGRTGLEVVAFGRPWAAELLESTGIRFAAVSRGSDETDAYRRAAASWGLSFRSSFSTALRMRRAGLRVIGRRGNLRGPLLHRALAARHRGHRVDDLAELAEEAVTAVLGRGGEGSESAGPPIPRLQPTQERLESARRTLVEAGITGGFMLCCPTAGHQREAPFKLWPRFPDFMAALLRMGRHVVVCPAPGEIAWYRDIPEGVRVIEGIGLGDVLSVAALAESVVSNDTGQSHLAAAAGTPTLAIFGDTSPERYAPRGPRASHVGREGRWPTLAEGFSAWRRLVEQG
jgi:heptosyltransferase-2